MFAGILIALLLASFAMLLQRNWRELDEKDDLKKIARAVASPMRGSKGMLSDDELWSIIVFLRHLPPAGGQGISDMYTH